MNVKETGENPCIVNTTSTLPQINLEAQESSDTCHLLLLKNARPWTIHVIGPGFSELVRLERPYYCATQKVEVYIGEEYVGVVKQDL